MSYTSSKGCSMGSVVGTSTMKSAWSCQSSCGSVSSVSSAAASSDKSDSSCRSLESMLSVTGYFNIGLKSVVIPPERNEEIGQNILERRNFKSIKSFTEGDAHEAIVKHVSSKFWWDKRPARDMVIRELSSSSAYHYSLETFGESRSIKWACEPYYGDNLRVTGAIPSPWDIQVTPPDIFVDAEQDVEVPNSAYVQPCFQCHGEGSYPHPSCSGSGTRLCKVCSGCGCRILGTSKEPCWSCHKGYQFCHGCNGTGRRGCLTCQGRSYLRWFIRLTITWTNHVDKHVEQRSTLSSELIGRVSGEMVFDEAYPRVWPITSFPVREIINCSDEFVKTHSNKFQKEKILMQRQCVQCVPVIDVLYTYKEKSSYFTVYGIERKVHAPDYPAKFFGGCTIM